MVFPILFRRFGAGLAAVLLTGACGGGDGGGNGAANGTNAAAPAAGERPQSCGPVDYENGCADLGASERLRGVWVWGDDNRSGFIPDATAAPGREDRRSDGTFLIFESAFPDDTHFEARMQRGGTAAYVIDFTGRRTRRPAIFGYRGEARNLVIVERIHSLRVLDWPGQ